MDTGRPGLERVAAARVDPRSQRLLLLGGVYTGGAGARADVGAGGDDASGMERRRRVRLDRGERGCAASSRTGAA